MKAIQRAVARRMDEPTALELLRRKHSEDKIAGNPIFAEILPATRRGRPDSARLFEHQARMSKEALRRISSAA